MARTTIGILLSLLTGIWCAWWFQPLGYNQLSRINMLHAMVVEGRMNIDTMHRNTQDVALYRGKYYSDKAPGTTYLGIPSYAVAVAMERALGIRPASRPGIAFALWWVTLATSVLFSMLGAIATWLVLLRFCARPRTAALLTMACWLGTIALPYGTMYMSHATTIGLLSIALAVVVLPLGRQPKPGATSIVWWRGGRALGLLSVGLLLCWTLLRVAGFPASIRLLTLFLSILSLSACIILCAGTWTLLTEHGGASERLRRSTVFGVAIGFAVLGEYMALLPAIALWAVYVSRYPKLAMRSAGIAAIIMLLLPLTNWLCFDHPLRLGYGLNAFAWMDHGFYGVTLIPRMHNLVLLLLSPAKGLLFWSPFLALAIPGWFALYRKDRLLSLATSIGCIAVVFAIAATGNAGGGAAVGPRYLAPIIALLIVPTALGYELVPRWGIVLTLLSIALNMIATAVDPMPAQYLLQPLFFHHLPALMRGEVLPSIGTLFGLQRFPAILPMLGCSAMLAWASLRGAGRMRKTIALAGASHSQSR